MQPNWQIIVREMYYKQMLCAIWNDSTRKCKKVQKMTKHKTNNKYISYITQL